MNRRRFLGGAAGAAALAAWPAFLRRAFADASCDANGAPSSLAAVSGAYRRAQRAGKPLVVLIVPADDGLKWERGHAFGEWLNHGSDAQLAPLALAEVVCATMAELKTIVPGAGGGEPLLVIVPTDHSPPAIARLDATLPSYREVITRGVDWKEEDRKADRIIEERIALLADAAARALPAGDRVAALAAQAKATLRVKPPAGARWASSSGCGTTIEGEADRGVQVSCGMGHTPEKSRRFLYLFSLATRK